MFCGLSFLSSVPALKLCDVLISCCLFLPNWRFFFLLPIFLGTMAHCTRDRPLFVGYGRAEGTQQIEHHSASGTMAIMVVFPSCLPSWQHGMRDVYE